LISVCTAGGMGVAAILEGVETRVAPAVVRPAETAIGAS
jgi:hypothetical protein